MDESMHWDAQQKPDADYIAEIERMLGEMRKANAAMEIQRAEIERLKAETLDIRDQTRSILVQSGARL
jgi:hypothetical protein